MRFLFTLTLSLLVSANTLAQSFTDITAPTTDLPLNLFPVTTVSMPMPKTLPSTGMAAPAVKMAKPAVQTIADTDTVQKLPYGFQNFTQLQNDDRVLDWLEFNGEIPRTVYSDGRHRAAAAFYGVYKTDRLRYYAALKTNPQFDTATREALLNYSF